MRRAVHLLGLYNEGEVGHAAGMRARAILEGLESHDVAVEQVLRNSGATAAQERLKQLWAVNAEDSQALATAQVSTLQGVLLKARAITVLERDEERLVEWHEEEFAENRASSTGLAVSLTMDLIRLMGRT